MGSFTLLSSGCKDKRTKNSHCPRSATPLMLALGNNLKHIREVIIQELPIPNFDSARSAGSGCVPEPHFWGSSLRPESTFRRHFGALNRAPPKKGKFSPARSLFLEVWIGALAAQTRTCGRSGNQGSHFFLKIARQPV